MKRKLCSVLLALCMVLTLLPVSAMAEDGAPAEAEPEYVAQIGNQGYATLAEAVEKANDGDTITLLSDTTVSTPIVINKTLTLNLNNKIVTVSCKCAFQIRADGTNTGGSLTIDGNGTINGNANNGVFYLRGCETSSDSKSAYLRIGENVEVTNAPYAIWIDPVDPKDSSKYISYNVTVDVYGKVTGTEPVYVSGNIRANEGNIPTINIHSSASFTMNVELYLAGYAKTTIDEGATLTNTSGNVVTIAAGELVVNGGTFTGGTTLGKELGTGGAINTDTSSAIFVKQHSTNLDTKVTINGGTFKAAVPFYQATGAGGASAQPDKVQLTINGGNFESNATVDGGIAVKSNDKANFISGGTFSDLSALDYLASGASVTVKLAADTTKDVTIPAGATVTLDLNGKTLTNVSGHTITNNGNLTVTGNGTVQNNANERQTVYNNPGAVATLNGGHYEKPNTHGYVILNHGTMTANSGVSLSIWSDTHSSLFENGWYATKDNTTKNNPSLTINGGTYNGGLNTIKNDDDAVLTINGGTFTNYTQAAFQNHGTAAVNGGTFTADSLYSIDNCGCDATHDPGKLTITNGTFTGTLYVRSQFSDVRISGGTFTGDIVKTGGSLSLTGGTYSVNPTAYVADTHIARKDGDTKFVVVEKANLTAGVYTSDPSSALAPGYVSYKNSDNSTYTVYYPVPVTPGNTSSTTTTNPDGSTTTTTTDKATGTVTETTKNPDGSTTTVETKKDGSVTETNKTAGGSVGTVKTDANGNSEISASISAADVNAAAKKNEPVAAPVSVAPAASSAAAPVIKLSVPASAGEVSVVIPVVNAQQGTVAIKVNPDGTEEIIKTSVVTKDGLVLGVKGSMQIKVINNSKNFADTVGHWAESDVDFVSARELFTGTAPQTFSPESATTRGMVVTVLARLAGESTDGGANWYDKGCAWAVTNGVSDGTDPNGTVTREQLAAMLYRYFGSPAVSGSLSFADASSVSEYAHDAMQWCVNNGIINGMDGLLNPQGQATRAQVSAMFARYIHLAATK